MPLPPSLPLVPQTQEEKDRVEEHDRTISKEHPCLGCGDPIPPYRVLCSFCVKLPNPGD
jgi:hypothetical protein